MVPELVPGTMRVGQRGDANHANLRVGSEARVEVVKTPPGGAQDENPPFGSSRVGHAPASVVRMVDAQQPHIHYESCSVCYGVFFDAGEFRDYKEDNAMDFFRALFAKERN